MTIPEQRMEEKNSEIVMAWNFAKLTDTKAQVQESPRAPSNINPCIDIFDLQVTEDQSKKKSLKEAR